MNRRDFLKHSYACAACAMTSVLHDAHAVRAKAPNILLILADDLGWADTACYGADLHETPNIDHLAKQGIKFSNAYAAAPVCTPTRASIHTGKSPARLHMTVWHEVSQKQPQGRKLLTPINVLNLPQHEVTLAEALRDGGYATAHVGKWHLGDAANYPEVHGFDLNIGGTFWGAPPTYFYSYRGQIYNEFRYVPRMEGGEEGEYLTDRLTDEAMSFMEEAGRQPFFLNLSYHTVHIPIEGKKHLIEHYEKKIQPGMNHQNPTYAAMVHSLDENIGRLLSKLDELGIADNTLVLFTSDNGGLADERGGVTITSNHPLRSGKGSLYEGGIRVPMVVRWPDCTTPGSVSGEPVVSTDLYPTILEAAGLSGDTAHNANLDGRSLMPLLSNSEQSLGERPLFFHFPHYHRVTGPVSAVRAANWKLLEYHEDNHVELYNLVEDLGESNDLAPQNPELAEQLRRDIHEWRDSVNAQMPEVNTEHKDNQE